MDTSWTIIARWMLHAGVGGGLILALTLLAMARVKQPARRQRLGEAGLAAALALCLLACGPAWIPLHLGQAATPEVKMTWTLEPVAQAAENTPSQVPAASNAVGLPLEVATSAAEGPSGPERMLPLVVLLYGAGAAFFLGRWLLGWAALTRLLRASRPAPAEMLLELAAHLPRRPLPRLLIAPRLRVPISCGVRRPTIVLPKALADPSRRERRACVFAHELTHLERRDAWSSLLFAAGQVLFFAAPWFWRLQRQVRLCQEFIADAAAVERQPADEYAEFLLSLTTSPAPRGATGVSGTTSDLYRRVTMLLDNPMPVERRCPHWWTAGAAGALVGLAVVGAGVGFAQAPPNQREVLEQLDRIQDMVNKLRRQVADDTDVHKSKPAAQAERAAQEQAVRQRAAAVEALAKQRDVQQRAAQKDLLERQAAADARQKIDELVRTRVREANQKPDVERTELIRRLFLDLRGTLPTPEELKKYLAAPPDKMADQVLRDWLVQRDGNKTIYTQAVNQANVGWQRRAADGQLKQVLDLLEHYKAQLDKQAPASKEEVQKRLQEIIDRLNQAVRPQGDVLVWTQKAIANQYAPDAAGERPQGRLGIRIDTPSDILIEQLNLPKGKGLVVAEVFEGSVAKKAGIQVNDILIKINNQPVDSDAQKLLQLVKDLKADAPFDIVVVRRGKEQTIAGVKLAAAARPATGAGTGTRYAYRRLAEPPQITITLQRSGKEATVERKEGGMQIILKAALAGGKAKLQTIVIQEKGSAAVHGRVEEVPAEHRDKVEQLLKILSAVDFTALPGPASNVPPVRFRLIEPEGEVDYYLQASPQPSAADDVLYFIQPLAPTVREAPLRRNNLDLKTSE